MTHPRLLTPKEKNNLTLVSSNMDEKAVDGATPESAEV